MKKIIALLFLCSLTVFSQKTTEIITSLKLKEDREITIGLPASYEKSSKKKYPLLILLDGDYLFEPFQGALNYGAYWDDFPEVIIVGINQNKNNERNLDCTFDPETGLPFEKGEQFFDFIGQELVPYIEKKYRIAPFKIIAGHDITAGFLNFFLYKDHPLFNAYISLSPDFAKGMEEQIPERLSLIKEPLFYYQSTADGDVKKLKKKIATLDAAIKVAIQSSLNYKFDEFIGATHYSLVLQSIPNALTQLFSVYQPISSNEYADKIGILQSGYVDYLINKHAVVEKTLDIKMPIRISDFKAIEAAILQNSAYPELDKLATLAEKYYPKSMLSDYYLAVMYEKMGLLKKAIATYRTAYQKGEIGDLTKTMMLDKADELKKQ